MRRATVVAFGLAVLILFATRLQADLIGIDQPKQSLNQWAGEQLLANQSLLTEAVNYYRKDDIPKCQDYLAKLAQQNPALPAPELVVVWLLLGDRKVDDAKNRLERLAASLPHDPQVALTLGQLAIAERRFADAWCTLNVQRVCQCRKHGISSNAKHLLARLWKTSLVSTKSSNVGKR